MDEKTHIFDNPKNVKLLLRIFYVCCGLLISIDLMFHRHVIHPWEAFPGFYGLFGAISCLTLVVLSVLLRKIVMRDENYYQKNDNSDVDVGDRTHHEH